MYHQPAGSSLFVKILHYLKFVLLVPFYRLVKQGPVSTVIWLFVRGRLIFTDVSTQRFSKITDTLYVGGQIGATGWERLQAAGVTSIVNMRREHDDRASGIDVPVDHYLHVPTIDDQPVDLDDLRRGADWIAEQIAQGGVIYVHCAAGSGRAPSMGAAYLMAHQGMGVDEALATIRARRPFAMPMPGQLARLREFEASLKS